MPRGLPLPIGYFRCPPLSPEEARPCIDLTETMSIDLIRHAQLHDGPISWTLDARCSDPDMQVYTAEDMSAPPGIISYCTVTTVKAAMDEVASLFYTDSTAEYRAYCQHFAKGTLDAAVLYTLASPTPAFPRHSIAIKWNAFNIMPGMPARDGVFLECHNDFDIQGRRGWVRCCKSIEISCCPDLHESHGLVRASFYRWGFVCVETDVPGTLRITYLMQIDVSSRLPRIFLSAGVRKWTQRLATLQVCLWRRNQCGRRFLSLEKFVPQVSRGRCFLCQRKFGAFGAKESCLKCGHVVCRCCSKIWHVAPTGNLHWRRICNACAKCKIAPFSHEPIESNPLVLPPSRRAISLNNEFSRVGTTDIPWQGVGQDYASFNDRRTTTTSPCRPPNSFVQVHLCPGVAPEECRRRGQSLPTPMVQWHHQDEVQHNDGDVAPPDDMALVRVSSWSEAQSSRRQWR
ncbi:hypothetical protein H310_03049 [Aphanomyces invadans]|uniref:FYVE-type domain-containing protein n=1 Tax=Aphanomyces invadans TaxID=157072 RepID=A0A024UMX2_9STRA|nr:hypothetical protein H310_03049 [Aphanomyces invadans]ETW06938.1 hypothetical protein H310_03049 [Aphanomyces invadans]|eukprot:XP_008865013.1 hypothetical protein H310_03049 [Aphanomyces invadans]